MSPLSPRVRAPPVRKQRFQRSTVPRQVLPQSSRDGASILLQGPLDAALTAYTNQSGVTLQIDLPAEKLANLQSAGVQGVMSSDSALSQLLLHTGIGFHFTATDRAVIGVQTTETVDVTASLSDSTSLTRLPESLLDTPQTVNVVPQAILVDEQNRTLTDALRNVPGNQHCRG